jgi:hypothetical protein
MAPTGSCKKSGGFRLYSTLLELANKWCPKRDNYIPRERAADKNSRIHQDLSRARRREKLLTSKVCVCAALCMAKDYLSLCWLLLGPSNERGIHHQPL